MEKSCVCVGTISLANWELTCSCEVRKLEA